MPTKTLLAFAHSGRVLFHRLVFNKAEARRIIRAHKDFYLVAYVKYQKKIYNMTDVLTKWPVITK